MVRKAAPTLTITTLKEPRQVCLTTIQEMTTKISAKERAKTPWTTTTLTMVNSSRSSSATIPPLQRETRRGQ